MKSPNPFPVFKSLHAMAFPPKSIIPKLLVYQKQISHLVYGFNSEFYGKVCSLEHRQDSKKECNGLGVIWRPLHASPPYVYQEPLFRGLVRALVVSELVGTMATLGHCLELAQAAVPPSSSSGARSASPCSRSLRPSSEGERESLASPECQPYPDQSTRTVNHTT